MLKFWKAGPSGSPMISNGESLMKTRLCLLFATVAFFSFSETYSLAQDYSTLRERVLQMSHSTRIDDAGMKPWHMKAKFQLYDEKGEAVGGWDARGVVGRSSTLEDNNRESVVYGYHN